MARRSEKTPGERQEDTISKAKELMVYDRERNAAFELAKKHGYKGLSIERASIELGLLFDKGLASIKDVEPIQLKDRDNLAMLNFLKALRMDLFEIKRVAKELDMKERTLKIREMQYALDQKDREEKTSAPKKVKAPEKKPVILDQ